MITVVLNAFKRTSFLAQQIKSIQEQTIEPQKILIWQNKAEVISDDIKSKVVFSECNENLGVWARFAYALNADTEYVCIFDDDTIPGKMWFENCLQTIKNYEGLLGARGLRFLSKKRYEPYRSFGWDSPNDKVVQVDIVGHAWFFRREWLGTFWRELPPVGYSKLAGEDMHFSYALQKYLNISTYVPPHPTSEIQLWGSLPDTGRSLGANTAALSAEDQGLKRFNNAFAYYIANGFQLVGDNSVSKPIVFGSGLNANPFLRKIANKSPLIQVLGRFVVSILKKINIYI